MAILNQAQRKKLTFAYLAGIIDGEGCITIQGNKHETHTLKIRVTMAHKRILELLLLNFGGHLWGPYTHKGKIHHKLTWEWCIFGKEAFKLLKKIDRYLIVKREESHIARDFCKQLFWRKRKNGITQITKEEYLDREIWRLALQQEKRGGEYQYGNL